MDERDWTHDEPPRKIWLQWYDEDGKVAHPEDRTYVTGDENRIYPKDICFVRWGKTNILAIERDAARARAEAAERRVAELEEGIRAIDKAVAIQCSDGNWNYDPYMHGMANGLLLAQTYMAHPTGAYDAEHYKPLSAPERWLSDVAPTPPLAATE